MLIARYEVSYKIIYLHNTIRFPYRGEFKKRKGKERKTFRFLKYRLKITFSLAYPPCNFPPSNPINADANYAIPNNFVLETLCSGVEGFEGIIIGPKVATYQPPPQFDAGTRCSNLGQIPACSRHRS